MRLKLPNEVSDVSSELAEVRAVNGEVEPAGRQPIQRDACAATRAADVRARADVQEVGPVTPGKRHLPNFADFACEINCSALTVLDRAPAVTVTFSASEPI